MTIYHNPRCSKSRNALALIEKSTNTFQIIEYLKYPPSESELKKVLQKLGMNAEELVRKKEPLFLEKFSTKK
jgi:arsenate reductase (glutaredoxin)